MGGDDLGRNRMGGDASTSATLLAGVLSPQGAFATLARGLEGF